MGYSPAVRARPWLAELLPLRLPSAPAWTRLAIAAATALLCALLAPAVVNGDGLGYLKAAPTGTLYPGHLAYLPLLRLVGLATGRTESLALLGPARALSMVAAATAGAALHAAARRLYGGRGALWAGLGLGVSFGSLQVGSDVETYAPALAAMCLGVWCAVRRRDGGIGWTVAAAACVAAAALLHIENVIFAPAAALLCARRDPVRGGRFRVADALLVPGVSGVMVLAAYLVAFRARGDDLRSAIDWVFHAGHGFAYPVGPTTPLIALYGMAKTLVYAPYPYEASWGRVIAQTAAGVFALAVLAWLWRRPGRTPVLHGGVALAWIAPYLAVGIAFFASDNERWLFLLPPVWLCAGAAAETSPRAGRVAALLVAGLLLLDLAFGLPVARDRTIRERAERLTARVRPSDLVISPGHSWDEYVGFYQAIPIDRFPMVYFCGDLGGADAMRRELLHRVIDARARGAQVFLARIDEPGAADGWKELAHFGITPANVDALLPPGRRVPIAPGLLRLDE
ncbi:MAG: hypothetical protein EXR72_17670 [Myxococcales bacterium]|nr:hypothetical protein [Myxococcales bacterium]